MRPVIALALLLTLPAASALATDYHVGPGQTYANINDVPIESFAAGDTMFIHYRATPYAEKFVLCVQGTPGNPVTISGVADGDGNLPVLTGDGAVTRTQTNYWREDRGVIKIGGANTPGDTQPQYIIIENLDIRSARPGFTFTDDGGNSGTPYASNAAAVDVEKGDHLTIRNCIIHDCGNGIFAAGSTSDLTIERCYIHSNGIEGQFLEHNTYTESDGILYQYNHFGPLRASCDGNNLKDRSAGCVIRYNWIEGGNRQMDLVDSQDKHDNGATDYANTFVYGNVLLEGTNDGNRQIVHYGGDSGNIGVYRSHLYFHHNTIVSRRTDKTVMVRLSDTGTQLDAYNNIVYVTHAANQLAVLEETGVAHVENCWMRPGFINSHSGGGFTGSITYTGTVTGSDPGFEDFSADDFRLLATSTAHDAGAALLPATSGHDVTKHYLPHRAFETRTFEGTRDIGAYELGASAGSGEPTPGGGGGGGGGVGGGSGGCAAGASGSSLMLLPFLALLALLGVVRRRSEPRPSGSGTSEFPMNTAGAADVVSFPVPLPHGRGSDSLRGLAILLTTLLLVGCTTSGGGSLGGPSPVSITTASLPNGLRNNAYSQTLATSGGVAPLTFSISVGSLPAGLSLNASTGAITGTPTTAETQNFTITATDSATPATTDDAALSITINAPPALTITTTSVATATQNRSYSAQLQATGGVPAYSWAVTVGTLPAGLSLNAGSGLISGTPTAVESQTFTVTCTDSDTPTAATDTQQLTIDVQAEPAGGWQSRGIGGGGALFSASWSHHTTQELYIATDMTAVFHSTDDGANWTTLDFRELLGGHRSEVRFTSDPQVLYAIHCSEPREPRKSTDGGATWTVLSGNPVSGDDAYHLFADPADTQRVIVSSYDTLYISTNGGTSFNPRYTAGGNGLYIGGVFWDGTDIFVGTNEGLLVSTNGGTSFANEGLPAAGYGIISMAGARNGGTVRLFSAAAPTGDIYGGASPWDFVGTGTRCYVQTRGGSWAQMETGLGASPEILFAGCSAGNVNVAWLAGGQSGRPQVWRTTDGAANWSPVLGTNGNTNVGTGWMGHQGDLNWGWAEHALGFGVSPTDTGRAIIVDWGFAHVTTDGGATWHQAYVASADENTMNQPTPTGQSYAGNGLQQTAAWWLEWSDANTLLSGFTDIRGLRSADGGDTWRYAGSFGWPHNTTYHVKRAADGKLYCATSTVHDMYESTYLQDSRIDGGDGQIMVSSNGGTSWSLIHDFNHPVIWIALDPTNANTMYASVIHSTAGGIFRTQNLDLGASSTWTKLADPPRTEGHPFNMHVLNDGTLACSYSGRRTAAGAFTTSSGVFVSTNGGTSWIDRTHTEMQRWTKDLVIDPHDANQNTWYACVFSHWGSNPNEVGGIFRTVDRGQNWSRISDLYRVESMTVDPADADHAYVATETEGLWETTNLTSGTPAFTQVADFPFQHPTRIFFNPHKAGEVWVVTFGNGLYVKE